MRIARRSVPWTRAQDAQTQEKLRLFATLEARSWTWRDGALYAPNETLWLERDTPWHGHPRAFRERVSGRIARIVQRDVRGSPDRASEAARALRDAEGLITALDAIFD